MSQVIKLIRVSKRCTYINRIIESTESIQERHLKHLAEITRNLAPPQSEELNYEQKQWLYFRMSRPIPKPYRPYKPIVIPYKWQEDST